MKPIQVGLLLFIQAINFKIAGAFKIVHDDRVLKKGEKGEYEFTI